jgi:hypothetical protein
MSTFSIDWREVLISAVIFTFALALFAFLSGFAGWPNTMNGWPIAVGVALLLALLRFIGPTLDFLQRAGAKVEAPFLKFDFAAVARATAGTAKPWVLSDDLIRKGPTVAESTIGEIERSAQGFAQQSEIVLDLEDGSAWYTTRVFAVAATAALVGCPKAIVFVGQKHQIPRQFGGWIRPEDVVTAFQRHDSRFADVHTLAFEYYNHLMRHATDSTYTGPTGPGVKPLPKYLTYRQAFLDYSEIAIMRILVDQMKFPDQPPPNGALEQPQRPPWIALGELESILQPWLVCSHVNKEQPSKEQVLQILSSPHGIIAATQGGQYMGVIDVGRTERDIIRQLVIRAPEL